MFKGTGGEACLEERGRKEMRKTAGSEPLRAVIQISRKGRGGGRKGREGGRKEDGRERRRGGREEERERV